MPTFAESEKDVSLHAAGGTIQPARWLEPAHKKIQCIKVRVQLSWLLVIKVRAAIHLLSIDPTHQLLYAHALKCIKPQHSLIWIWEIFGQTHGHSLGHHDAMAWHARVQLTTLREWIDGVDRGDSSTLRRETTEKVISDKNVLYTTTWLVGDYLSGSRDPPGWCAP